MQCRAPRSTFPQRIASRILPPRRVRASAPNFQWSDIHEKAPTSQITGDVMPPGLLDQTPAFDPVEPDPVPDQRFASVPSSSTSPCPTTSTPDAPESRRPGNFPSSPFPAHPRISPAHSDSLTSRGSPAALCPPPRPLSAHLRRPPSSPLARPRIGASSGRSPRVNASSRPRTFAGGGRCPPLPLSRRPCASFRLAGS